MQVRFRIRPCTRCGRIHVPAHVLAHVIEAAGGLGTFQIEQRIVIGTCAAEGEQAMFVERVWIGVARILNWAS